MAGSAGRGTDRGVLRPGPWRAMGAAVSRPPLSGEGGINTGYVGGGMCEPVWPSGKALGW